jgi:hypothetical protein
MMNSTVDHITNIANLLDEPLREKLWDYAELLYIEQVAYDAGLPLSPLDPSSPLAALIAEARL